MFGLRVVRVLLSKTEEREATYKMDLGQVFTNSIVAKYMVSLGTMSRNWTKKIKNSYSYR